MKRIRDRVGALDVHRDPVVGCVRLAAGDEVAVAKERFGTTSAGLAALGGGCSATR